MMAMAMVLLPLGDSIAKFLLVITPYGPEFLAWSRFAIGSAMLVPVVVVMGLMRSLGYRFYLAQALRGALVVAAICFIIRALDTTPLADAFGAFFVGPSLATLLAAVLLRERVGALEWTAVLVGFVGVLLVVRPAGEMQPGILWALLGGVSYGGMLVATRWAAGTGAPLAQVAAQFGFGCLFLMPVGVVELTASGVHQPNWLITMCACSVGANLLSVMALSRAPAAFLAPVVYLQIVAATVVSTAVFGDPVDMIAAIGLSLIVAAGLSRISLARRSARQN